MPKPFLFLALGPEKEKAQEARHKLDRWRQAFRLDKNLQFKLDRSENTASETEKPEPPKPEKAKIDKAKPKAKAKSGATTGESNGNTKLIVRLYFSGHEKLSEQRWVDRIPSEEPFKGASPKIDHEDAPEFSEILQQFDTLD